MVAVVFLSLVALLWVAAVLTTRRSDSAWSAQGVSGSGALQAPLAPDEAIEPVAAAAPVLEGRASVVDPAWVAEIAVRTGIPAPAVQAYAAAALRLGQEQPGCGLGWTTLAGIGWIESGHGTHDGRTLEADGHSNTPVIGPALDGRGRFAAIRSHPATMAWHGDTTWDHAVGPMQFIGSTWESWASDGDEDGVFDPTDIDDAAYAAGRYLCASGSMVGSDWATAVLSYNHSESYVRQVWTAADTYAKRAGSSS